MTKKKTKQSKPQKNMRRRSQKNMRWRLSEAPTVENITKLISQGVINEEEARQLVFSSQKDRDNKSLKEEIKFLRELVEKLSNNRSQIVETIREVERPWRPYPWYKPYVTWCSGKTFTTSDVKDYVISGFSDISTF
ncbi:MAG: hypothetical protein ACOC5T_03480 [Elusimicrobiota bacterium]